MKIFLLFTYIIFVSDLSQAQMLQKNLNAYLKKLTSLNQVNLANEKVFTAQELIIELPVNKPLIPERKKLISPILVKLPLLKNINLAAAKVVYINNKNNEVPPVAPLAEIQPAKISTAEVNEINITDLSPDDFKILQAMIYFEIKKKYDLSMSLFTELTNTKYQKQAELYYAESAAIWHLPFEHKNKMFELALESIDKQIKLKAVQSLIENIESIDLSEMEALEDLVNKYDIDVKNNNIYWLKLGNYLQSIGEFTNSEKALLKISNKSDHYNEAVLLLSNIDYRQGQLTSAISKIEAITVQIDLNKKDKVNNLLNLMLARLYFQKAKYKESFDTYLKIDRESSVWLQAMMEQAWAQILVGDYIGAAGNMFSLHTDFFKKAYVPESYIVRSVGYLNLCQYGDALHVLTDLNLRFENTHKNLKQFAETSTQDTVYYELVKNWFTSGTQTDVKNVPKSFVAELANHPSFTSLQKKINASEVEAENFEKLITELAKKDQALKLQIQYNKNTQVTFRNQKVPIDQIELLDIKNEVAELEIQMIKRSTDNLKKMKSQLFAKLENNKIQFKKIASSNVRNRFNELTYSLGLLLEQEEVLAYEVYSGAGEHLRGQLAGADINTRTVAALTPEQKKSYKWKFRGELWEDEIGHYRSSLKNVCTNNIAQTQGE